MKRKSYKPDHPGPLLLHSEIERRGMSIAEFARRLGVSRSALASVCRGESGISPDMAMRIAKLTRGHADSWLGMQGDYDLWKAAKRLGMSYRNSDMEGVVMAEGELEKSLLKNIWHLADKLKASQKKRGARK